ncbi:CRTAC1 family protein [Planctomyces sp. SH-PL62]|uniref:CRTAC1 family protein n=1 Tax=Planctomyces sp. SH-PL62 TaxID=1636152 RepID=UPI00078CFE9E|nr:CRTAC1 family protein [Planctomyces sp. SH-PL62]AMV38363.1 ASPIC and UnbV [Planctomyces sp. SH-PL62]
MPGSPGRIAAIILFAGLLAAVPLLNRGTTTGVTAVATRTPSTSGRNPDGPSPRGFRLEEVSKASGIDFVHQAPTLDPKLDHIMPQIASMGAGVAAVDFDRDGWQDLYVTNSGEGSLNRLYRNRGDGAFEDVAGPMGLADLNQAGTGVSMGSIWGDYDNDGYDDLFLYKWGRPELFHNDGGRGFSRVTESAGFAAWINAGCATWLDFDRDGLLDLFVGGYWPDDLDLWRIDTTKMMPESFEYAKNGGANHLYRNLGEGRFEDVTGAMGLDSPRWALCAGAADLRGTGYPDLFVANDYGVSELFANDGGRGFREIGKATGVGYAPKSGMNVSFGDVFNQGRFSIYVTNISEEGVLIQGNNLWVPREGTSGDSLAYDNLADDLGVELGGWSFGAQFGDLNNDGNQDLVLTNGYISAAKDASYWYDYSVIAGGHSSIISDAKNWPAMRGKSLSGYQQKKVWVNDGAGRFAEVAQAVGYTDLHDGRAVVLADLWNRGVLDLVVANQKGPLLVYKNTVDPANEWIGFDLTSRSSNRSAIGAEVRVFWDGQEQLQQVSGGGGYSAQNPRRLHFGLGKNPKVEKAVIRWPSGREQVIETPTTGRVHQVEES